MNYSPPVLKPLPRINSSIDGFGRGFMHINQLVVVKALRDRAMAWAWMLFLVLALRATTHTEAVCSTTIDNRVFASCQELQSLGATYAWTFNNTTNTVDFAFSEAMQAAGGWVGWGVNPMGPVMQGTQALVAFADGTVGVIVKEYNVTLAQKVSFAPLLPAASLSVAYTNVTATMTSAGSVVTIFASCALARGQSATINQVWNRGPSVNLATFEIAQHDTTDLANLQSAGTIDLSSGIATVVSLPHLKLKNTHGVINAVSWGILLPLGVMAARYLRPFAWADPLWFYLHITCQLTGYALGVVGWGLGLKLQQYATPIRYYHRNLGIAIFVLATLQVLAVVLRPKKEAQLRVWWNVYHHTVGYATIILIVRNIFEGIELLQPASGWKSAYITVLAVLGVTALILEVVAWVVWFRRRSHAIAMEKKENQQEV